ncbi:alpha/beta hydrolase [Tumidithrix elongata RA019]|uniref:Alpha/beta hydrolase n=1 Tax=Tumidithrix elongata BACA0141 TaxID=2716417 RepID=A0AAW9PUD0_9CYAN|nr:alpha/beta hydrolase [Tumidithrix elongata RA019]
MTPDFLLFTQHGWADDCKAIALLAKTLATPQTLVTNPDLGWLQTWLSIDPLIAKLDRMASQVISSHPNAPIRIVGHSLGGLLWLELLNRHPEWRSKVHSLVLVGSPVGGSDLGRVFDPLGTFPFIAKGLATNRRPIAEAIASEIPTLIVASDIGDGSDGTVSVECTKFERATFVRLAGISHAKLKNHPQVAEPIRSFWLNPQVLPPSTDLAAQIIRFLHALPITDARPHDFLKAQPLIPLQEGLTLSLWKNLLGVDHVFVADAQAKCLYSGYFGWGDAPAFYAAIDDIKQKFG